MWMNLQEKEHKTQFVGPTPALEISKVVDDFSKLLFSAEAHRMISNAYGETAFSKRTCE